VCFLIAHDSLQDKKVLLILILEGMMYCMTHKKKIHKNNKTHCATPNVIEIVEKRMMIPPDFGKSH
jgi:hypothetical protein